MASGFNKPFESKLPRALGSSYAGPQVWECVDCRTERQYGHGQPGDKLEIVWLLCEGKCNEDLPKIAHLHTRHTFVRVKAGWVG